MPQLLLLATASMMVTLALGQIYCNQRAPAEAHRRLKWHRRDKELRTCALPAPRSQPLPGLPLTAAARSSISGRMPSIRDCSRELRHCADDVIEASCPRRLEHKDIVRRQLIEPYALCRCGEKAAQSFDGRGYLLVGAPVHR